LFLRRLSCSKAVDVIQARHSKVSSGASAVFLPAMQPHQLDLFVRLHSSGAAVVGSSCILPLACHRWSAVCCGCCVLRVCSLLRDVVSLQGSACQLSPGSLLHHHLHHLRMVEAYTQGARMHNSRAVFRQVAGYCSSVRHVQAVAGTVTVGSSALQVSREAGMAASTSWMQRCVQFCMLPYA
jgi:hypothetical protein